MTEPRTAPAGKERVSAPGYLLERRAQPNRAATTPPLYFAVLVVACSIALCHEVVARQTGAYLAAGVGPPRAIALAGAALGALVGLAAVWKTERDTRGLLSFLLAASSLSASGSAFLLFFAFPRASLFAFTSLGLPALVAGLSAAMLLATFRALGRTLRQLDALEQLLNPFRLLGFAAAFGIAAAAAAQVGLLRSAAFIGLVLAVLSVWCPRLFVWLEPGSLRVTNAVRSLGFVALAAGVLSLFGAERLVPLEELAFHEGEILYTQKSEQRRYTIASSQHALSLFSGHSLRLSTLDEHRYFESLVQPALAVAKRRERVLVLGGGHGLVERELVRDATIRQITLVVPDRALPELARRLAWLNRRAESALFSARLELIEEEPILFLAETPRSFDVAILDLDDPVDFVEGKNYTRYFYALLAARLEAHGVAALQATDAFATPRTFASVLESLRAAGLKVLPYQAPIATIGNWGFALVSREPLVPPRAPISAARFVSPEALAQMFELSRDVRVAGEAPSLLHDQRAVARFSEERSTRGK